MRPASHAGDSLESQTTMTENTRHPCRHPSTYYSDAELLALLRASRRSVTAELLTLKHDVRERVSRMEALERRLDDFESSEQLLQDKSEND
jgi:hypothetical protein